MGPYRFVVFRCFAFLLIQFVVLAKSATMDMEYDEISDDDLDDLIENVDAEEEQESAKPGQCSKFISPLLAEMPRAQCNCDGVVLCVCLRVDH